MNTCANNVSMRFLAGLLTDAESVAFEDHLEVCLHCREQLEREAGGEVAWGSARELLIHQTPNTSSWISSGEILSDRSSPDSEWLPACTSSVVLSILSPTDDSEFVGRIGTYEISGIVGRGSAGIVLRGFDRALHRNVAIKILDPAIAGVGAARQRFAREARAMAAISHEHVVPVYEVSEHSGLPFFVMEYVPGGSLERRLRTHGPFDVESVIRIGLQIAQALATAHASGLVHRDIKPGNILLDRGTERVRVADFGLVRVANDVSCTRSGFIAGTPQYMAPEQVRAEVCDGRSDLFSLGSLMYALCTGHSPFRAETVYAVMQRIVHDSPRSARESNSLIPLWLDEFILKMMSKNRDDRFATADEVARILQEELAVHQDPGKSRVRSWMPTRRNRSFTSARIQTWGIVSASILGLSLLVFSLSGGFGLAPLPWVGQLFRASSNGANVNVDFDVAPIPASWDEEEMAAAHAAMRQIVDELQTPESPTTPDPWDAQIREFRKRLSEISKQLDDLSITEPLSLNPSPVSFERE